MRYGDVDQAWDWIDELEGRIEKAMPLLSALENAIGQEKSIVVVMKEPMPRMFRMALILLRGEDS